MASLKDSVVALYTYDTVLDATREVTIALPAPLSDTESCSLSLERDSSGSTSFQLHWTRGSGSLEGVTKLLVSRICYGTAVKGAQVDLLQVPSLKDYPSGKVTIFVGQQPQVVGAAKVHDMVRLEIGLSRSRQLAPDLPRLATLASSFAGEWIALTPEQSLTALFMQVVSTRVIPTTSESDSLAAKPRSGPARRSSRSRPPTGRISSPQASRKAKLLS